MEEQLSSGELDLLVAQQNAFDQYMQEPKDPEAEQPGEDSESDSGEHFYS